MNHSIPVMGTEYCKTPYHLKASIDRHVRIQQLKQIIGLSRSTIYAMMDEESCQYDPDFPRRVKLGKSAVAWREAEVAEWLASRPRCK